LSKVFISRHIRVANVEDVRQHKNCLQMPRVLHGCQECSCSFLLS